MANIAVMKPHLLQCTRTRTQTWAASACWRPTCPPRSVWRCWTRSASSSWASRYQSVWAQSGRDAPHSGFWFGPTRSAVSSDAAAFGPRSQPPDEESVPGAPVLPADPSVRGRPQTGLHLPEELHLQGDFKVWVATEIRTFCLEYHLS